MQLSTHLHARFLKLPVTLLLCAAAAASESTTVNVQVGNQIDSTVGVNGRLRVAMSTSFQVASWSYQFFNQTPQALAALGALQTQHTRVQLVPSNDPLSTPGVWDFSQLDTMMAPLQSSGDHSPEFQIAGGPAYMNDSSGDLLPGSYEDFASMSADLVLYYNTGGFDVAGTHFQSPSPYPITWWGIFNEPNGNGLTAQDYVNLYNTMVPAMAQADPAVKFAAVELADWGHDAESFLPTFVSNVTAPVDVLATHFYSTCSQKDTDDTVFPTVLNFASEVSYIRSELATQPDLASVPVWVTENNINSDNPLSNGLSYCNGTPFVLDQRGTSPFFAAWRSLVFELLGQAGAQALYHWDFSSTAQYSEIDSSGNPYLSYWVDYYLSHWLPSPPGQDILQVTSSGCCLWIADAGNGAMLGLDTHTLALRNPDGSVVILMSNHAVKSATDNNGTGVSRTFALDLSALGSFATATLITLDSGTPLSGPALQSLAPSAQMQVTLPGYGAALLRLSNAAPNLTAAGVVNGASFASGPVSPGEIVSLFGSAIGAPTPAGLALTNPRLVANSLAGVQVFFDGVPAPLLYASAEQVNVVVPYSVAGQSTTVLQLEYLGALSSPVTLQVAATAPAVFGIAGSGRGPGAILNSDGTVNSASNPVAPGDWVSIFATGAGVTTPASVDGFVASAPLPVPNASVSVSMGGLPCQLNFEGAAPGLVSGVLQINAQVPAGVAPGPAVPIQLSIGSANSPLTVTVAVQ
jgi:uncharacterized protein (TIGR03437 family)